MAPELYNINNKIHFLYQKNEFAVIRHYVFDPVNNECKKLRNKATNILGIDPCIVYMKHLKKFMYITKTDLNIWDQCILNRNG